MKRMANITVPIQVNLPDDWMEQIVNRLRNDPESEWVEIIRCKDCTYRNGDYCHRFHDGYSAFIHLDDFCNYAERRIDGFD